MIPATAQSSVTYPEQQAAAAGLSQPGSQWFGQVGQAEVRLSGHSMDSLSGGAELLLPFVDQPQELLFTQWGLHRNQRTTTLNAGIGYRWFDASQGYWGTNLFYDRQFHSAYHRWGIGIEQCYRHCRIALNSYFPIQALFTISDKATAYASPAFGIDLRCQYQIPTLPHWRVNLQAERYWGDIIVSKGKTVENHSAMTLGVDYTPIPLITAGYGFRYDNTQKKSHQLHLQLNYRFGVPSSQQLNPQQVAANRPLNLERLALVQRNPQIVLRQIAVIKLELPSQLVGAPRTTHIIRFKLTTPHPQDRWRWTYSTSEFFVDSRIEIVSDNEIAITLPSFPGHYTVRLMATNQRGVSVTSNPMSIHVKGGYTGSAHANTDRTWSPDLHWKETSKPDQRMRNIFQSQEEIEELEKACACFNLPCSPETVKNKRVYIVKYRKLALKYHPDKIVQEAEKKFKDQEKFKTREEFQAAEECKAAEEFKAVSNAYSVLNKATEDYNK